MKLYLFPISCLLLAFVFDLYCICLSASHFIPPPAPLASPPLHHFPFSTNSVCFHCGFSVWFSSAFILILSRQLFVCKTRSSSNASLTSVCFDCGFSVWFSSVFILILSRQLFVCKTRSSSNASLTNALTSSGANFRCHCCVCGSLRQVSFMSLFSRAVGLFIVMEPRCWCCLSFV